MFFSSCFLVILDHASSTKVVIFSVCNKMRSTVGPRAEMRVSSLGSRKLAQQAPSKYYERGAWIMIVGLQKSSSLLERSVVSK
jgi:hypothetical protein